MYGALGLSKMNLKIVYFEKERKIAILRLSLEGLKALRAMICIKGFLKGGLRLHIAKVTGTVRKAKSIAKSL